MAYFTNSWHGLCDDILPYFNPSVATFNPQKPVRLNMPISITMYEYMNGLNSFTNCIENLIYDLNCQVKCMPFYLYSTATLPFCEVQSDNECIRNEVYK